MRTIASAVTGMFGAALLAVTVTPASAGQETAATDHVMGASIRAHEGAAYQDASQQPTARVAAGVRGIDVSSHQGNVDWVAQHSAGKRFAWVKATEGTGYTNPYFSQQYNGSAQHGFIRGAYHYALPARSSGTAQADYFLAHGGKWSADGKTLPGALDMEYGPRGNPCWGLSKSAMSSWIRAFSNRYKAKTDKYPAIYTSASWWSQCSTSNFASTNPLWVARYASAPGSLPGSWHAYSVWQYSNSGIDQDLFNGSSAQLAKFARNHD